jgi:hypothetical protein
VGGTKWEGAGILQYLDALRPEYFKFGNRKNIVELKIQLLIIL